MAVKHSSVTVGDEAGSLLAGVADEGGNNYDVARSVVLTNASGATVYVGGPGVTTTEYGYALASGASLSLDLGLEDIPFAVVATGTATVRVLHLGV